MSRPSPRRPVIAVIGGSDLAPAHREAAAALGAAIRTRGFNLCTGGMGGVMEAVSGGFAQGTGPGVAIGILRGGDLDGGNPHLDIVIPTAMGYARNAVVVLSGDAVVAFGGAAGTMSELGLAWQNGKPIVAYTSAGGIAAELAGRHLGGPRTDRIEPAATVEAVIATLTGWLPLRETRR